MFSAINWDNIIWPLAFILVALFMLRDLRNDLHPIFRNVIGGVAKNAQSNALPYALALITATLASLQELSNVAREMHWPYVAAICRVFQPGLATIIAYAMKPPASLALDQPNPKTEPPAHP